MTNPEEFVALQKVILADSKMAGLEDRYERMRYFVKRRDKRLANFGDDILKQLADYEARHVKSTEVVDQCWVKILSFHSQMLEDASKVTRQMYEESYDMVNRALRYLPHNWTDWGMMVSFLQLYLIRSQQSLTFGCLSRAVSDYGHAFTLLTTYDNPEAMREWFTQQESHLLVEMIQLKGKLLAAEKIAVDDVHFNAKSKQSMNRLEVDGALEMLFQLEKLSNEADVSSESLKVKGQASSNKSYEMSTKIKLHKAEAGGGRCFLASEYIAKGETILTEKPYSVTTFQEHIYTHCNYCHIAMETFWPCHECTEAAYCSRACAQTAFHEYHRKECGIRGYILGLGSNIYAAGHVYHLVAIFGLDIVFHIEEELLAREQTDGKDASISVSFFDPQEYFSNEALTQASAFSEFSKDDRRIFYRALASLLSHRGNHEPSREAHFTSLAVVVYHCLVYKGLLKGSLASEKPALYAKILEHLATIMLRICTNGFCWATDSGLIDGSLTRVGSCLYYAASLLNHSCVHNVSWDIERGVMRMNANRVIAPGERLLVNYGPRPNEEFTKRQERLSNHYCFHCLCAACVRDVANGPSDIVACKADYGFCRGPVVELLCLRCDTKMSPKMAKKSSKQAANAHKSFLRVLGSCKKGNPSSGGSFSKLGFSFLGVMKKTFNPRKSDRGRLEVLDSVNRLWMSLKMAKKGGDPSKTCSKLDLSKCIPNLIVKLEGHLSDYAKTVYSGSYRLLELCALMLAVYEKVASGGKDLLVGFYLIEPLTGCLEAVAPSMIDASCHSLLYALDIVALYFEGLSKAYGMTLPEHEYRNIATGNSVTLSSSEMVNHLVTFTRQLNSKLVSIFQYDIEQRGELLPRSSSMLEKLRKGAFDREDDLATRLVNGQEFMEEEELHFRQLYMTATQRLQEIEEYQAF